MKHDGQQQRREGDMGLKKAITLIGSGILISSLLSGCSLFDFKKEETDIQQPTVSRTIQVSDQYYSGALPYLPSQSRGTLRNVGTRIDMTRIELGLMEIAQNTFDPAQFLFREGQMINREDISGWLEASPVLVHVLEHDYLNQEDQQLAGAVINLTLNPAGEETEEYLTDEELRTQGRVLAEQVIQEVRKSEPDIPMVITLYAVNPDSSLVPGHFIAAGRVNGKEDTVAEWKPIEEKYYILPGREAAEEQSYLSMQYDHFEDQVQAFFSDYIGMVTVARFVQGELVELTMTANAEYDSKMETLQFMQYTAGLLSEYFEDNIHVNLYVQTIDRPLALYVRPVTGKGEPYFHIYRNN